MNTHPNSTDIFIMARNEPHGFVTRGRGYTDLEERF